MAITPTVSVENTEAEASGHNRRAHSRYAIGGRGTWVSDTPSTETRIVLVDISIGGIGFRSPRNLLRGGQGLLRFSTLCDGRQVALETRAEVRYCILGGADFMVGVQLVTPNETATKALAAIIATRSKVVPGF